MMVLLKPKKRTDANWSDHSSKSYWGRSYLPTNTGKVWSGKQFFNLDRDNIKIVMIHGDDVTKYKYQRTYNLLCITSKTNIGLKELITISKIADFGSPKWCNNKRFISEEIYKTNWK